MTFRLRAEWISFLRIGNHVRLTKEVPPKYLKKEEKEIEDHGQCLPGR